MPRYIVRLKPSADKEIKALPVATQSRIVAAINRLADNPRPRGCAKLQRSDDRWRIRVGDYRVVYTIMVDQLIVTVVRVGHRKDVYRN